MNLPRRIVTRIDSDGKSHFVRDGVPPVHFSPDSAGEIEVAELWATQNAIELPASDQDPTLGKPAFIPALGETRFRMVTIAPTQSFDLLQASHRDDLVEYLVILSGQIHLILPDGSERLLSAGDCVVQQGTTHAWCNRSQGDCRIALVVVGAKYSA